MCFPGNLSCRGRGGYRRCRADPREAGFGGPIRRGVSFRESGNRRLASWPVQWRVGKEKRRVGPASWSNRQAGSSAAGWPECRCRPHVRSFPTWTPLRPRLPASASDPGRKPHPNHLHYGATDLLLAAAPTGALAGTCHLPTGGGQASQKSDAAQGRRFATRTDQAGKPRS